MDDRTVLQRIGDGLDLRKSIEVLPSGLIVLEEDNENAQGQETENGQRQAAGRPAAGSRKGSRRRKGSPGRPRTQAPRPRVGGIRADYERQLGDVRRFFPDASLSPDDQGLWLLARAKVLEGLEREAIFLVALPDKPGLHLRGWAYWGFGDRREWIGPRHTNLFDGSVCAFAESDCVWSDGGDLRTLLGVFTLWALRHLHLDVEGRWPGRQYALLDPSGVPHPYYRRVEFKAEELCSCNNGKRYGECCMEGDYACNFDLARRYFESQVGGPLARRFPPKLVREFMQDETAVPSMKNVHFDLAQLLARRS